MCREKYILPKVEQSLGMLARVKRFRKLDAIMEMKEPKNVCELKSFLLGNQLGNSSPSCLKRTNHSMTSSLRKTAGSGTCTR